MVGVGGCPYIFGFGKKIALTTSTENNDLGEAKARNHPLIHKRIGSSF